MLRRLLKHFFHHLYHRMAWAYDGVAAVVSLGKWQRWGLRALDFVNGPAVLEMGIGPGHLHAALLTRQHSVFGLDESPQMLRAAAQRLKARGANARLTRGLAQHLPFASGQFDTALATFPSEYIVEARTLSEVMRTLKPGGLLVTLLMAWPDERSLAGRLLGKLFRLTGQGQPVSDALRERICAPFEAAGFITSTELVEESGSTLVFVVAQKPGTL